VCGVFSFPVSSQIWVATGHTREEWEGIAAAAQEKAKVADYYSSNTCSHHLACHVVACTGLIYCSLQIRRERKLSLAGGFVVLASITVEKFARVKKSFGL
jgi:hypothetical protein